jgi:hypothetical protein
MVDDAAVEGVDAREGLSVCTVGEVQVLQKSPR